jgi:hypothetical protein
MQNEFEIFIIVARKAGLIIWPLYNIITLFLQLKNADEPLPAELGPAAAPVLPRTDATLRRDLTNIDELCPTDFRSGPQPATIHSVESDATPRSAIAPNKPSYASAGSP